MVNDQTSAAAQQSGDDPEILAEDAAQKEIQEVILEADEGQEEVANAAEHRGEEIELAEEVGDELHPGIVAIAEQHDREVRSEHFGQVEDPEGEEGVKTLADFDKDGLPDSVDPIVEPTTDDTPMEETILKKTERVDLADAQKKKKDDAGSNEMRKSKKLNRGSIHDGSIYLEDDSSIELT